MKGIRHHVERVRAQPHHVRKRVTMVAAGTIAGLIGLGWLGGSLAAGAFALNPTSFQQALNPTQPSFATTTPDSSNLAGAAAAFDQKQQSEPAHIVIINAAATDTAPATTTQTTIPF